MKISELVNRLAPIARQFPDLEVGNFLEVPTGGPPMCVLARDIEVVMMRGKPLLLFRSRDGAILRPKDREEIDGVILQGLGDRPVVPKTPVSQPSEPVPALKKALKSVKKSTKKPAKRAAKKASKKAPKTAARRTKKP